MVIYQVTWNEGGMDEPKNRENIFTYTNMRGKKWKGTLKRWVQKTS